MAVKRSSNILSQQRIDTNHLRSIESGVRSDFDTLLNGFITGASNSQVINGFAINMTGSIGSAASALQVIVAESALLHGASNTAGTFLVVPAGTANEILNTATNSKVTGAFTPGALNYIGIELKRAVDNTTASQVYFWDATSKTEFTQTVPLAETLNYTFVVSSSTFASNILPIAVVSTDASNNVIAVEDARPMLFRLGTAGFNTPDPSYVYPWNNQSEGRLENPTTSSSSTISPFKGGDKMIKNMKEWMDAIMSSIKEIKGTSYWYTNSSLGSIAKLRQDLSNSVISGRGVINHDAATAGKINWSDDIFINFIGGNLRYNIKANTSSSYITLADNEVAYINLVREIDITPNLVFTQNVNTVTSIGAASWTSDVIVGDFIKIVSADETKYYEIASINSLSQVTLTSNYLETSSPAAGESAQYAYGSYQAVATPSTDRHIKIVDRAKVPFTDNAYWLFFRADNSSAAVRVYVRFTETELSQGETQTINNGLAEQVLQYIGSASETNAYPIYTDLAAGAKSGTTNYNTTNGQNLTDRASALTSMMADKAQDKTIKYAENFNTVKNLTSGANQLITFVGNGTPSVSIILPSSTNFNNTITLTGTLTLAVNQVAYFTIDRNNAFSLASLSTLTISSIASMPLDENIFVFAYRLSDVDCYLYNNKHLKLGGNPMNASGGLTKVRVRNNTSTTLPTGATTIDDISIIDQDRVLFTNLSSNNNRIYAATVVAGNVTGWNAEYDFAGYQDPSIGDLVNIAEGTVFGGNNARFNGTIFEIGFVSRYFNGNDYYEESALLTSTINNNISSPAVLTSYNYAGSEHSIVEYSISRGSTRETGILSITTDGTNVAIANSAGNLASTGVIISADISGASLRILYTSDNSGSSGLFKFTVKRWSNSAGGPAGLPSYTGGGSGGGSGTGTVTSSGVPANGEIAIFTGTTDITSNSNFKIDTVDGSFNLNGLHIGELLSATLSNNTVTPTTIASFDTILFPYVIIEYSLERNGERRIGRLMMTHNGVSANISDDNSPTSDLGVTFSNDISGSNMRLLYVSTLTGFNINMKYSIRKWA
jgi:hypothetical protein